MVDTNYKNIMLFADDQVILQDVEDKLQLTGHNLNHLLIENNNTMKQDHGIHR